MKVGRKEEEEVGGRRLNFGCLCATEPLPLCPGTVVEGQTHLSTLNPCIWAPSAAKAEMLACRGPFL